MMRPSHAQKAPQRTAPTIPAPTPRIHSCLSRKRAADDHPPVSSLCDHFVERVREIDRAASLNDTTGRSAYPEPPAEVDMPCPLRLPCRSLDCISAKSIFRIKMNVRPDELRFVLADQRPCRSCPKPAEPHFVVWYPDMHQQKSEADIFASISWSIDSLAPNWQLQRCTGRWPQLCYPHLRASRAFNKLPIS